jgi:hypothetical protein
MKRLALMVGVLLLAAWLIAPAVSVGQAGTRTWTGGHSGPVTPKAASSSEVGRGSRRSASAAGKLFREQGYLVPNQAAYERAKTSAAAHAPQASRASDSKPVAPKDGAPLIASGDPDINPSWTGQRDPNVTPPDTTGAIGPSRYIELVNDRFGIYDRNGNVVSQGGLRGLAGANTDCVTDPQIIWDPQTNRFYYVVLEFSHFFPPSCPGDTPNSENRLYIGFSRSGSPKTGNTTSWCKYFLPYFPADFDALPDYPKLGDNSAFMVIGSNVFDNGSGFSLGSDVTWITKPHAGTGCPALGANHLPGPLQASDGNDAFTPVPANQTDTSGTGYIVATSTVGNTFVDTYAVSTNFSNPVGGAVPHAVAAFSSPPSAPQPGSVPGCASGTPCLDTLDARLTNSVSGLDPSTGTLGVWTQHTVAGGAGSEVRWYEINPAINPPTRFGAATDASLYAFNGAISSDRKASGSIKRFGDAFVLGFNTSSTSDFTRIQMVSKWANNPQSEFVEVKASPGINDDFTCGVCRWGDYSGASPDPAANQYSNHGRVWLANQWNIASVDPTIADWRTYVWGTNPVPFVLLNGPSALFQKGTSFTVSWSLGNQASAADVRYRRAPWNGSFGGFIPWQNQAPAGRATFTGSAGNTYCFSAQSYDETAGGPRAWGFGAERCTVVPLDDRSLTKSSRWSRLTGSGFFLNTYSRATGSGQALTRTGVHAKRAQVMVEKCPTCGSIKIYWNGSLRHTYSLHAGSTRKKVYLSAVSFSSVRVGTLKIVVSSSGKPVIIDAVGVSAV